MIMFVIGLFIGIDAALLIWCLKMRSTSGTLILDLYNDDADAVPISLELYIPIEEVRKKKTIRLDVHESR